MAGSKLKYYGLPSGGGEDYLPGVALADALGGQVGSVAPGPVPYGALGHYRAVVVFALVATQAANSRLLVLRNNATNLLVVTRCVVRWLQTATHTAAIEDSLDLYKLTGFTVLDTTNTVTPTAAVLRTTEMAAAPGGAQLRHVTVAGAAAGMTGATSTKAGQLAALPKWLTAAVPTAAEVKVDLLDFVDDDLSMHPLVLKQNEGLLLENRVLLGAAAGSSVYVDLAWAETTVY